MATQKRVVVYIGVRVGSDDKLRYLFVPVEGDWKGAPAVEVDEHWAFKKDLVHGRAGAVYELDTEEKDGTRSVTMNGGRYLGMWPEEALVTEWQALSDAERAAQRAKQQRAKETKENRVFEALEPLRRAYAKADPMGRSALLAQVVHYVRGGR